MTKRQRTLAFQLLMQNTAAVEQNTAALLILVETPTSAPKPRPRGTTPQAIDRRPVRSEHRGVVPMRRIA